MNLRTWLLNEVVAYVSANPGKTTEEVSEALPWGDCPNRDYADPDRVWTAGDVSTVRATMVGNTLERQCRNGVVVRLEPTYTTWGPKERQPGSVKKDWKSAPENKIRLGQEYTPDNFTFVQCLAGRVTQYPLPTEIVLHEAGFHVPDMARVYRTELLVHTNSKGRTSVLTDKQATDIFGYDTRDKCVEVILAEVWYNDGDDGHTHFFLHGWVFLTQEMLDTELQKPYGDRRASYPSAVGKIVRRFEGFP